MAATVIVNKLTVVHKHSGGVSAVFPDVCRTPVPGGSIPIPYPNTARSTHTQGGSRSVRADGNPIMVKSSCFAASTGDEAGSDRGVASDAVQGKAYPKMYSFDVKVEGENVFRLSDLMTHNGGSPTNTGPSAEVQPNRRATAAAAARSSRGQRATAMKWDRPSVFCGDEVFLIVKTRKVKGRLKLPIRAHRAGEPSGVVGRFQAKIKRNRAKVRWTARRGPYRDSVTLAARQTRLRGKRASTNVLEVKTLAPVPRETIGPFERLTPKFVETVIDGNKVWINSGTNYGWQVGYDIEVRGGELVVTHRLDFEPQPGVEVDENERRDWKRDIERIWDRKFRVHRALCKRGDACDCPSSNGCCSFTVRVLCEYGPGHGDKTRLFPGSAQGPWGSENWWYSNRWYEQLSPQVPTSVRAHEFGHQIGVYDEYPAGACDPERRVTDDKSSLMGGADAIYDRHLVEFHAWFIQKAQAVLGPTKLLPLEQ